MYCSVNSSDLWVINIIVGHFTLSSVFVLSLKNLIPPDPMARFHLKRGFPQEEFPDLCRNFTWMGRILTLDLYRRQFNRCTQSGVIFDDVIRPGLEEPGDVFFFLLFFLVILYVWDFSLHYNVDLSSSFIQFTVAFGSFYVFEFICLNGSWFLVGQVPFESLSHPCVFCVSVVSFVFIWLLTLVSVYSPCVSHSLSLCLSHVFLFCPCLPLSFLHVPCSMFQVFHVSYFSCFKQVIVLSV